MSVKVRRERPDQRRHHRVTAPLLVTALGHTLRAADWSLGGLRLEDFPDPVPAPGTDLQLKLALPFQGFDVGFDAKGEVVRNDPATGMFALKFTELGEREMEVMRHFIEELVRGSMSDIGDTIQRIDLPVTPVSTAPDVNPKTAVPVSRWPIKTIFYSGLYAVLGLFVFSYIAMMGYTNVFRLEVDTAVISAPLVTVQAPNDGHVMWTQYKPGDVVKAGSVVLQVADNQLERDIDLADLDIRERTAKQDASRRLMQEAMNQLEDLSTVAQANIEQAKIKLESLQASASAADAQYKRILALFKKGYATRSELDLAGRDAVTSANLAKGQAADIASQGTLASRANGDRYFTGNQFLGERAKLEAEIRLQDEEIKIAGQRKQMLMEHRLRLAVIAPFDGLVMELPRIDHASVNRGDVIAVLEQPRSRVITAYLTQDEVLHVGIGDEATVYVPAFDTTLKAKVTGIDRTSGFADEMHARFNFRNTRDRSAVVTLQFLTKAVASQPKTFRSGTPVVVIFKSRSTSEIVSQIESAFNLLPAFGGSAGTPVEAQSFPQQLPAKTPATAKLPDIVHAAPLGLRPSGGEATNFDQTTFRPSLADAPHTPNPQPYSGNRLRGV